MKWFIITLFVPISAVIPDTADDLKDYLVHNYYSSMAEGESCPDGPCPHGPDCRLRDAYKLTGHVADDGGAVAAQCLNETKTRTCSHNITFGESFRMNLRSDEFVRNFSTTIGSNHYLGHAMWSSPGFGGKKWSLYSIQYYKPAGTRACWLVFGRNPSPEPNCNEPWTEKQCNNQTDAFGNKSNGCTWCTRVPENVLPCFPKASLPKSGWTCDGNNGMLV